MSKALTDLLAKVEAETLTLDVNKNFQFSRHWSDEDWHNLLAAYRGSLDAAKTLHEAMLPEYGRSVDATVPEMGIEVSLHKDGEEKFTGDHQPSEARAWLIAILKALIAKDQAND